MRFHYSSALAAWLMLTGCVAQRTAYTLQHAHVSPDISLPKSELEQIVREVTRRTLNPVLCITDAGAEYPSGITVYTLVEDEPARFLVWEFRKQADGRWHGSTSGVASIMACP